MSQPLNEHVARTICLASNNGSGCPQCHDLDAGCFLWETFLVEADCAIEAVRDYAIVQRRTKARTRDPADIVAIVKPQNGEWNV